MRDHTIKIKILSTLNTNIGDEFIRDGLISVLSKLLSTHSWSWEVFNKHQPWSFYPNYHPARLASLVDTCFHRGWQKGLNALSYLPGNTFFEADLVIQSGTPIIWNRAYKSEWAIPFWKNFAEKNQGEIPLLNLGGGSCYSWVSPPSVLTGLDRDLAALMVKSSKCITTRDPLASRLLSEASGHQIPLLPCSAFLAGQYHTEVVAPDNRILLNIMPKAGHFDFQNDMCSENWIKMVNKLIRQYSDKFTIEFICHNQSEYQFAKKVWPDNLHFLPSSPKNYFEHCKGAEAAVVNRLHAAVGLSGLGIPSVAIGTDTRLLMTKEFEIPSFYAPNLQFKDLAKAVEHIIENRGRISNQLLVKRDEVFNKYLDLLAPIISTQLN